MNGDEKIEATENNGDNAKEEPGTKLTDLKN